MKDNRIGVWLTACLGLACTALAVSSPLSAEEPKLRDALQGHKGAVKSVAFSPDGKTLASASSDGTVRAWDVATGQDRTLHYYGHDLYSLTYSPDGKSLAWACGDKSIKVWDLASDKETGNFAERNVSCVAFSPDSKTLASAESWGKGIKLLDAATGTDLVLFKGHTNRVNAVAFSPDGKTLASASSDGTVRAWDVATGKGGILQEQGHEVYSVTYSSDGKSLAWACRDRSIKVWNLASGKETGNFKDRSVSCVAFSPDSKILASAGDDDKTIKLLDAATGKELASFGGHTDRVNAVAFSPDGKTLASASSDRTVRLWDIPGR